MQPRNCDTIRNSAARSIIELTEFLNNFLASAIDESSEERLRTQLENDANILLTELVIQQILGENIIYTILLNINLLIKTLEPVVSATDQELCR